VNQPALSPEDYARSVVAVPPIALEAGGAIAVEANRRVLDHIAKGGIETVLYGGNANLYHYGAEMFREALDVLFEACPQSVRLLFSIGPDFGKAMDQAGDILKAGVRNVLILPTAFPSDPRGVAEGARRLADRLGFGIVLYVKRDQYIDADDLGRLVEDGAVSFVKYAVERPAPANDAYLDRLVAAVGAERISSGMGETPIADHIGQRHLATFTSGAVCIAPAAANELLALYRAGKHAEADALSAPFLEFERQRARLGGTAVLHDAVTLSGIADCGPLLPMLSNLADDAKAQIRPSIGALLAAEDGARGRLKAA
jgi:dihydrodipicolinate synthase/N-acetylneuraminate lyase